MSTRPHIILIQEVIAYSALWAYRAAYSNWFGVTFGSLTIKLGLEQCEPKSQFHTKYFAKSRIVD